jgi:hypothetical protein
MEKDIFEARVFTYVGFLPRRSADIRRRHVRAADSGRVCWHHLPKKTGCLNGLNLAMRPHQRVGGRTCCIAAQSVTLLLKIEIIYSNFARILPQSCARKNEGSAKIILSEALS